MRVLFPEIIDKCAMGGGLLATINSYVSLSWVTPSKNRQAARTCVQTPFRIRNADVRVACWN